jgi:hypothetical protein
MVPNAACASPQSAMSVRAIVAEPSCALLANILSRRTCALCAIATQEISVNCWCHACGQFVRVGLFCHPCDCCDDVVCQTCYGASKERA